MTEKIFKGTDTCNVPNIRKTIDDRKVIVNFLTRLYDPHLFRKTGRTTILAEVFILLSMQYIGNWIYVIDHYPNKEGKRSLIYTIKDLLTSTIYSKHFDIVENEGKIRYNPKNGEHLTNTLLRSEIEKSVESVGLNISMKHGKY